MTKLTPERLGCSGAQDPYCFEGPLNRTTITGENSEDYRLVLFFIKKGTAMPLHDHPNMSVFFRLVFRELAYHSYDKLDDKLKYNDFSSEEYAQFLATKKVIRARRSHPMRVTAGNLMHVRPSLHNMHTFTAKENSCFFDICLPNYTMASHDRKITYFKDLGACAEPTFSGPPSPAALTDVEFYATPPVMPANFDLRDISFRGEMN